MIEQRGAFELAGRKVWVAGHRGLVGAAVVRRLRNEDCQILTVDRAEVDLTRQLDVERWVEANKPECIVVAAANVGGVLANASRPADFIYQNLAIEANIIESAHKSGTEKLLFLGSSCIYPRLAEQPLREEALLTGPLEPTNEWYAIAKIAGIKLCEAYRRQYGHDFISAMPTNLYGPGDNLDLETSHVLPALMRKMHEAKRAGERQIEVWGTGTPLREFMYVDDLADALVFLLRNYSGAEFINVGVGYDVTIQELVRLIGRVIGWEGEIRYDSTKPDGTPRKLMDITRLTALGWRASTSLEEGIAKTYQWMVQHLAQ